LATSLASHLGTAFVGGLHLAMTSGYRRCASLRHWSTVGLPAEHRYLQDQGLGSEVRVFEGFRRRSSTAT
jgi:hypothetical protein